MSTNKMPASFMSLPPEIRIMIYKYVLVDRSPLSPWKPLSPWHFHDRLVPNLLRTSTTIFHEARSLLYSHNCFNFSDPDYDEVCQFMLKIGRTNASRIQYIRVDFPGLDLVGGRIRYLSRDSALMKILIESWCPNIKCLIIAWQGTESLERAFDPDRFDDPEACEVALKWVEGHFKVPPSLREIVIEVREHRPSSYIQKLMKSLGWIVVLPHTYRGALY
ncbi:hypothetical protein N7541_002620 [Penicillium brevicompactum]|uniref:Uncharacterized protein n=1 Tax=Penicillium brevicompactum TaxID=5074 RepID=A0A9W9RKP3_PENBR|nr:hypothetical protein N7541_002620 [Penicillium brevicompactum]